MPKISSIWISKWWTEVSGSLMITFFADLDCWNQGREVSVSDPKEGEVTEGNLGSPLFVIELPAQRPRTGNWHGGRIP